MHFSCMFKPDETMWQKNKHLEFYVGYKYHMFPEMEEEFNKNEYLKEGMVLLEEYYDENEQIELIWEIDLPYGTIEVELFFKKPVD